MSGPSEWTTDLPSIGRGASKDVKAILAYAQTLGGWRGRRAANGHIQMRHEAGGHLVMPFTPSDRRALLNTRADIRRRTPALEAS